MEHNLETTLAMDNLRAPLIPEPITNQEYCLNHLRTKYKCYFVEYNTSQGAVMLPGLFVNDYGHDMLRVALLTDFDGNQFECLVERVNGNFYLTRGWMAMRDFYNIKMGAWFMLVYNGAGKFGLIVYDRFHRVLGPHAVTPPARFIINMDDVPFNFVDGLPDSAKQLAYSHDNGYFHYSHYKALTSSDVSSGTLVVPYEGFGQFAFHDEITIVKLVDECGNVWACTLAYVETPYVRYEIGGDWGRMIASRRIRVGEIIRVGAPAGGNGLTIYLILNPTLNV